MGSGVRDRVVEKVIDTLKSETVVTKYTGSGAGARIYGSHLSLIQDWVLPAVTIHLMAGGQRKQDNAFEDVVIMQIEPWFQGVGADAATWDDVLDCFAGIVEALHRVKMTDTSIGIKIIEMTQIGKGGMILDPHGIMHIPSRWRALATT